MTGKDSELKVVRQSRDGRRRYDEGGKRVLIEAALRPGASVARLAQEHGINANLLRKCKRHLKAACTDSWIVSKVVPTK